MQEKDLDTKVRDMFFLLDDEAKVAYVKRLIVQETEDALNNCFEPNNPEATHAAVRLAIILKVKEREAIK